MRLFTKFTVSLGSSLLIAALSSAQAAYPDVVNDIDEKTMWLTVGIGIGASTDSMGGSGHASLNYKIRDNGFISIRSSGLTDNDSEFGDSFYCGLTGGTQCNVDASYVGDIAALYNLMWVGSTGYYSLGAGVGYVSGREIEKTGAIVTKNNTYHTVGAALEAQAYWTPQGHFGLGVNVFGNANTEDSFVGISFSVMVSD